MTSERKWTLGLVLVGLLAVVWYRYSVFTPERETAEVTKVVFVTGGTDPFWKMTINGAKAAAAEFNADLTIEAPTTDEGHVEQTQILLKLWDRDIDGVALSPLDAEAQTKVINRLVEDFYVVTFDSDAPLSNRQIYVGTSNFYAGQLCAKLIREALPGGGKVAVLVSNLTKQNTQERKEGLEHELPQTSDEKNNAIEVVSFLTDEGNLEECENNIRQMLSDHPDLRGFIAMNGYHGPILLDVLRGEGKLTDLKLVTFDDADETLRGVENGEIYATIAQDPYMYGYEAVRMLTRLAKGRAVEIPIVGGGAISVRCDPIRKDDVAEFRKRRAQRLNEVRQATRAKSSEADGQEHDHSEDSARQANVDAAEAA